MCARVDWWVGEWVSGWRVVVTKARYSPQKLFQKVFMLISEALSWWKCPPGSQNAYSAEGKCIQTSDQPPLKPVVNGLHETSCFPFQVGGNLDFSTAQIVFCQRLVEILIIDFLRNSSVAF